MLRAPTSSDLTSLLELNNVYAAELGALTAEQFARLVGQSFRTRTNDTTNAFIIALEHGADYASPNYLWFSERFDRFAFIDRVAVAASARRQGWARRFYLDLIDAAVAEGHEVLTCEVNSDPPNHVSDAFHAALGFVEIGQAHTAERSKSARYLVKPLRRSGTKKGRPKAPLSD